MLEKQPKSHTDYSKDYKVVFFCDKSGVTRSTVHIDPDKKETFIFRFVLFRLGHKKVGCLLRSKLFLHANACKRDERHSVKKQRGQNINKQQRKQSRLNMTIINSNNSPISNCMDHIYHSNCGSELQDL